MKREGDERSRGGARRSLSLEVRRIRYVYAIILALSLLFTWTTSSAGVAPTSCVMPPSGMVAWWTGDNNVLDLVNGNNGTLMSGATYAAGEVGQAFTFGGSQWVEVPDDPSLDVPTAVTLDAWINVSDFTSGPLIVGKAQNTGNWLSYGMLVSGAGSLVFEVDKWSLGRYGYWTTNATLSPNTWHHVAATWQNLNGDSSDATLYIDGVAQAATFVSQGYNNLVTLEYTSLPLYIGRLPVGHFFNGLIDEVEIFDRVLSAPEIAAIYSAGSTGKCKQTVIVPSATGGGDITLTTNTPGCGFSNVQAVNAPADPDFNYPYGLVEFTLNCPSAIVTITYPGNIAATTYRRYGPTPDNPAPHWYNFTFNGETGTGAIINGNQATLYFIDGAWGDDDLTVNGVIVDQGGPGNPNDPVAAPTMNEWGMILFMILAGLGAVCQLRRQGRA